MIKTFLRELEKEIRTVRIRHSHRFSYVRVLRKSENWTCEGAGNSAAVFRHCDYPDVAIKIFSDSCKHIARQEAEVYRRLGESPFYPKFYGSGENFILMQYIPGISIHDCLLKGIWIPEQIVHDINDAVLNACQRGLNPRNLHAKNILIHNGRGYAVDVSEYMKKGKCYHWSLLRYGYYNIYRPFYRPGMKVPFWLLEYIRRIYRILKMTGIIKR